MSDLRIQNLIFLDWKPMDLLSEAGQIVGLSGASGSGKTLFLRAVADLDDNEGSFSAGDVERSEVEASAWRRRVMLVPAESAWWTDRVGDHFAEAPSSELLAKVNLPEDVMDWSLSRASVGERQRLGLVRALSLEPEVLLLDEPTSHLDPDNVRCVETLISEWVQERGSAVVWTSHDAAQLNRVCTRGYRFLGDRSLEEVNYG